MLSRLCSAENFLCVTSELCEVNTTLLWSECVLFPLKYIDAHS